MGIFQKGNTLNPIAGDDPAPSPGSSEGPIKGVDLFHEDNVTSWSAMLNGGYVFAILKASQGLAADPLFVSRYHAAKAAGLVVGAYHFYSTGSSQSLQASFFNSILNSVGYAKDDLPPTFDFENSSGDYSSADGNNALTFLQTLKSLSGRLPMLYCSDSVPGELGNPSWMKAYPLWVARYGASPRNSYVIWQNSENASIPGLGNFGDSNVFNGSIQDLKTWISKT